LTSPERFEAVLAHSRSTSERTDKISVAVELYVKANGLTKDNRCQSQPKSNWNLLTKNELGGCCIEKGLQRCEIQAIKKLPMSKT
jgi:hypothetical protein